ncbi:MAG: hypothetical protein ACXABY_07000 [Candidatus Thorarchaeota archaeon]|jgi:hypothetical protein
MTNLHVFHNDVEWVVAESVEDAPKAMFDTVGATYLDDDLEWRQLDDDAEIRIWHDELGRVSDGGILVLGTAKVWAEANGRGFLCSTEF